MKTVTSSTSIYDVRAKDKVQNAKTQLLLVRIVFISVLIRMHKLTAQGDTQPDFGQVFKVKDENMKKLRCLSFHMVCRLMF